MSFYIGHKLLPVEDNLSVSRKVVIDNGKKDQIYGEKRCRICGRWFSWRMVEKNLCGRGDCHRFMKEADWWREYHDDVRAAEVLEKVEKLGKMGVRIY